MPWDEGSGALLSLLGALAVVVAVLVLAYLFTRYVAGRTLAPGAVRAGRRMTVVEQLPLGREQKLLLVRMGEAYLLLGASQSSIVCLKELTAQEAECWRQEEAGEVPPTSFQTALRKVLNQRKR